MCCTSLRGAAFFGASVHTAVGVVLFARYVLATTLFTFHNFNNTFTEKVTVFLAPFMVYVTLLLALGVLIFHSVEKEYYLLLKWASVSFSLLQAALFVFFLLLRLLPSTTFLPLQNFVPPTFIPQTPPPPPPSFSVPHGVTLAENEITQVMFGGGSGGGGGSGQRPSDDPPDPGGGGHHHHSSSKTSPFSYWGILRLLLLVSWVGVTLSYLVALFLYLRQLNMEDTGHVFGHTHAVTRNVAFYVQPQYANPSPQPPPTTSTTATTTATATSTLVSSSGTTAHHPHHTPHHHHHQQSHHHQQQQQLQDNNSSSAPPSTHPSPAKKKSSLAVPSSNPGGGISSPNVSSSLRAPNSAIPAQVRIGFYAQDVCSRSISGSSDTLRLPPPQRHPHHLLRPQYRNNNVTLPPGPPHPQGAPYYPLEEQPPVIYRPGEQVGYINDNPLPPRHQYHQQPHQQMYHPSSSHYVGGGYNTVPGPQSGPHYGGSHQAPAPSYHHHPHHHHHPGPGGVGVPSGIIRGGGGVGLGGGNQDPISLV